MNTDDKNGKPRTEKTIKQKIASAQMRLNRLKTKEKSLSKSSETRLKIILGAEVAKVLKCHINDVDKPFVMGLLLCSVNINEEDKARLRAGGERFLASLTGRQQ